jgi:hypothetical protein
LAGVPRIFVGYRDAQFTLYGNNMLKVYLDKHKTITRQAQDMLKVYVDKHKTTARQPQDGSYLLR